MMELIITVLVGFIGGIIAFKLKVPAGAMIGSMLLVAAYSIITGNAYLPQDARVITQIAAGAFIGSGIKKKDVSGLGKMMKPAVLMLTLMITLDLLMGYIMYKATGISLVTCLFASAPGGIVDMSLISQDLGAESSKVAILQLVRLMSVMLLFPTMMKFIANRYDGPKKGDNNCISESTKEHMSQKQKRINLMITICVALVAGFIGYITKIPAGAMTFAMLSVGALNVFFNKGYMPINMKRATQVFAGILIGQRMMYSDLIALKSVMLPAFILLVGIIVVNICIGFLITKVSGLELITSLLASAPGGLSDMAIIAKDLGGDGPKVALLQLVRYVTIIAIFPIIIKIIIS
ncbi:AbrB family transcriptional regulator [Clostridium sp.]|uniref:AbrB family transcriptional regulator n=1 Tax=Clostridium sp. TaxID=1506 RepID=UPI001A4557FA|nr:AbrB family transcriptional regulator [Clostridium sp.]MBK5237179.1 AbrB family transcriptional regulator [Clostridium sp.]